MEISGLLTGKPVPELGAVGVTVYFKKSELSILTSHIFFLFDGRARKSKWRLGRTRQQKRRLRVRDFKEF